MRMFSTYEEWRSGMLEQLKDQDPMVDCPNCDGDGEIIEECHCCGNEIEKECEACEGAGQMRYYESPSAMQPRLTEQAYFRAVMSDLKKISVFTGRDFLSLSGQFIKEYRVWPCRTQ